MRSQASGRVYRWVSASARFVALLGPLVGGTACEPATPKVVDVSEEARAPAKEDPEHLSEVAKIRALLASVRDSELTFVQSGEEHDGAAAADELEHRLARTPAGVPTASQFIDKVGAGLARSRTPDLVRLSDGTMLPTRDWLLKRLAEIEGVPYVAPPPREADGGSATPLTAGARSSEMSILDALTIVERSEFTFVAPPRRTPKGKLKGKRKEYTGSEFSEMLRKKWELLGKDIHDLDTFVEEIASDAFVSMSPYLVAFADGHEEEFRPWLLDQLEARRQALTKGGAP